jgi:photosystem II stability/assembly factor-like uncharacterized protein
VGVRGGGGVALVGLVLSGACQSGYQTAGRDAGTDTPTTAGSVWRTVVSPSSGVYTAVWLDAPSTIYAVALESLPAESSGSAYGLAASHDDGVTWSTVPLTDQGSTVLSVAAVGPTDVYAVGYTYNLTTPDDSPPLVARSTDRGATFALLQPSFTGTFSAVAADPAGNPIGVGYTTDTGFFVRSTDGGSTWSRVLVPGTAWLVAIWATSSGTVYACGMAPLSDGGAGAGVGVVVRSDDGGDTWTTLTTAPAPLHAISGTSDGQRVVAVGDGFTEIESTDGGATWHLDSGSDESGNPRYSAFGGVWVQDLTTAPFIAAGNAPYVVRSVSAFGGPAQSIETWEPLPDTGPGLQEGAVAVAGRGPTDIWAVGAGIFHRM